MSFFKNFLYVYTLVYWAASFFCTLHTGSCPIMLSHSLWTVKCHQILSFQSLIAFSFAPCFCWVQGFLISCLNNYNHLLICPSAWNLALFQTMIMLTSTKEIFLKVHPIGKSPNSFAQQNAGTPCPLLSSHTKLPTISLMHLDVSCFSAFTPAVPPAWNSLPPLPICPTPAQFSWFDLTIMSSQETFSGFQGKVVTLLVQFLYFV